MKETMIDTTVTYTIQYAGKFYIIEHVPARVCQETGEQFFAPETVEHIQAIIKGKSHPVRVIETPIFEYAGHDHRFSQNAKFSGTFRL